MADYKDPLAGTPKKATHTTNGVDNINEENNLRSGIIFEENGLMDLCTDNFDYFTAIDYVGKPQPDNPNVIQMNGDWVELERYDKEEVLNMLMDPNDDLALTENNLALLQSDFSYEHSLYFANAQGNNPLCQKCQKTSETLF